MKRNKQNLYPSNISILSYVIFHLTTNFIKKIIHIKQLNKVIDSCQLLSKLSLYSIH